MTPLEKYAENFITLNYLIRSTACPGNLYQIANQFHLEHKDFKEASMDAFELNGRHYYPQESFINKLFYDKRQKMGQLILQYEAPASFPGLLEFQEAKTHYTLELSVRAKKIKPLHIAKDDLIIDVLFNQKDKEILFMSRYKNEEIRADIVAHNGFELRILRSTTIKY